MCKGAPREERHSQLRAALLPQREVALLWWIYTSSSNRRCKKGGRIQAGFTLRDAQAVEQVLPVLLSHLFSQGANAEYIQRSRVSYTKKRFLLPDVAALGERGRPWLLVFREVRLRHFFSSAATARERLVFGADHKKPASRPTCLGWGCAGLMVA